MRRSQSRTVRRRRSLKALVHRWFGLEALPVSDELYLASTGSFVGVDEALSDACLGTTVVDDFLWHLSMEQWRGRRPKWRWSSRTAWLAEYEQLCEERSRITRVARFYGAAEPRRR